MKKWLIDSFLPMWAKETVLSENRRLKRQLRQLEQENKRMQAYIQGLENGVRALKRITIHNGGREHGNL